MREEVVRPRLEACDDDVRVVDMLKMPTKHFQ
jgi:hypothetical protein